MKKIVFICMCFYCIFCMKAEDVQASALDNAYTYYTSYGNQVTFHATSQTDGYLYYATGSKTTSAGTRFRTLGWKVSVTDSTGKHLQTLYFCLGGNYMTQANVVYDMGYEYDLYRVSLSTLKERLNNVAKAALANGKCKITFDACMVVVKDGIEQGGMSDSGITWGTVYTTYNGIVGAAGWSAESKNSLKSYFNKSVNGLFYTVSVAKGTGISTISGAGQYCYGTYVTIKATPQSGYVFSHWGGSNTIYQQDYTFCVNNSTSWVAQAKEKGVSVTFYRNQNSTDQICICHTYYYGSSTQNFISPGWMKTGHHLLGWSHTNQAIVEDYSVTGTVTDNWINCYYPSVSLYAVWKENSYTIRFDGNGADIGNMSTMCAQYSQTIIAPENEFTYTNKDCTFLGWSVQRASVEPEIKAGDVILVSDLAKQAKVSNTNYAEITLYAVWDEAPVINAGDLYYSLSDARNGRITETEIASHMEANDFADGRIPYGIHNNNSFHLIDYSASDFTGLTSSGSVTQRCVAVDSAGNRTERVITVHIVDTTGVSGRQLFGKCRFINEKYLENSGLSEKSIWRLDESYKKLLNETVRKM